MSSSLFIIAELAVRAVEQIVAVYTVMTIVLIVNRTAVSAVFVPL